MSRQTIGTTGLPRSTRVERPKILPSLNGGSLPGLRGADDARLAELTSTAVATTIVSTAQELRAAVSTRSRVGANGLRIVLTPGDYHIGGSIAVPLSDIQIVSATPGTARVIRDIEGGASRGGFYVTGDRVLLSGINYVDAVTSYAAIDMYGSGFVIDRCVFEDCYRAVLLAAPAANGAITNNEVRDARTSDVFRLTNGTAECYVSGNRLRYGTSGYMDITATTTASYHAFVGNITEGGAGTITYTGASGSAAAGNVATVTVI